MYATVLVIVGGKEKTEEAEVPRGLTLEDTRRKI